MLARDDRFLLEDEFGRAGHFCAGHAAVAAVVYCNYVQAPALFERAGAQYLYPSRDLYFLKPASVEALPSDALQPAAFLERDVPKRIAI